MKTAMPTTISVANHLGLSLEPLALRGVTAGPSGELIATAEVPFTHPVLEDHVSDPAALVAGLNQLKSKLQSATPYAAVCLPEKYAFSRQHTLPAMPLEDITEAISWQLDTIFPFDKNDIYSDWKLLSQTKDNLTILVVAIQKSFLDQLKNCCEQAGILPVSFEPSAAAAARLIKTNKQSLIIVELNSLGSTATAVINDIASLTTTTFFESQTPPATVLSDIVKSIAHLQKHAHDLGATPESQRILLTGEKASPPIAQVLQTSLAHPVEILTVGSVPASHHVAYAAATALIEPPQSEHTINLLPTQLQDYYAAKIAAENAKRTTQVVSILTLVGVGIALFGMIFNLTRLNGLNAQSEPTAAPSAANTAQTLVAAQKIVTLFPKKVTPEQYLSDLLTQTPSNITLTAYTIDKTKNLLTLTGQAVSRQALLTFKDQLQKNTWAKSVSLPLSSLESDTNPDFKIEIGIQAKP